MNKLIKGRPLDNLEFLQWMKCYYDTTTGGASARESGEGGYYDAEERRAHARAERRSAGEEGERDDERTRTRRWWTTQGVETRDDNARGVIDGGDSGECADGGERESGDGRRQSASSARAANSLNPTPRWRCRWNARNRSENSILKSFRT